MSRGKTPVGYYTVSEVAELLGVSKTTVYTYVEQGKLILKTPPGRKRGFFLKTPVDKLARELQAFLATGGQSQITFGRARPEDMDELARLINALFDHWPNVEYWKEYLHRNPDIGYLLKVEGMIKGCAFIFPLPADRIADILSHETSSPILPDDIHPYDPGTPYHLYIRAVGIQPGISKVEKRVWGARLLSHLMTVFVDFGKRGIDIKTIWSRSSTVDGIRLLRHIGFTEVPSRTTSHNFLIEVKYSGLPIIEEYKAAFAEWKRRQEGA